MTDIVIQTKLNGVVVNGLTDPPEITIFRVSDNNLEVNADAMSDVTDGGLYKYSFTSHSPGEKFMFSIDADPSATGQTDDRFYSGVFDNEVRDLWNDHGLNPAAGEEKTITENVEGTDYDEAVTDSDGPNIAKSVVKAGTITTLNRGP